MNLFVYFLNFFLITGFVAWYIPYYNERLNQYNKHEFVLKEECWEGKFHPKVQHNKMTYDGLSTNCTEATVFTSVPVWLGAFNNMWEGSVFYTLLHATNWQLQVAYVIFGLVISVVAIWEVSKHIKWRSVAKVLAVQPKQEFTDPANGRKRILMKRRTSEATNSNHLSDTEQVKNLAASLISSQGLPKQSIMKSADSALLA